MKTQSSSDLKCSFPSRKRQHFVTYVTNGLQPCKPMILLTLLTNGKQKSPPGPVRSRVYTKS